MCVVKAWRKGGSDGHTSAPHCFGDFGVSVLHRPGCHRLQTSPLNLEPLQGSVRAISMSEALLIESVRRYEVKSLSGMTADAAQPSLD